ncbi:MAG: NAD(P)-dependent oxidoreductase [Dermatophilaceae bacterium]
MARITVLGGTGYAGTHIVRQASARGHAVTSFSRKLPDAALAGVTYLTGTALDRAAVAKAVSGAQVAVVALAPAGDLAGRFEQVVADIAEVVREAGARLGVVGGAGTLLVAPNGPMLAEAPDYPPEYLTFSRAADGVLRALRASDPALDWFVLTPAREFGAYAPGEATGRFRIGGDVLLTDEQGRSRISGADLATALVNEVESPAHIRARFTVAY